MPTASSILAETPPQQAVAQFKQEVEASEALQKLDFSTQYQQRAEVVNDGAMLAVSVTLMRVEGKPPSLEMPCLEGITVRMNLTDELSLALCNMLQLSAKEAGWGLGASSPMQATAIVVASDEEKKILH